MPSFYRHLLFHTAVLLIFSTIAVAGEVPGAFSVNRIRIDGRYSLKKKEVLSAMAIKPPARWRIWVKRPVVSEEEVADDAKRIIRLYKSYGFYHVGVQYAVDVGNKSMDKTIGEKIATARVTFHIEEGAPVFVDTISIETDSSETSLPETDLLLSIPLKTGLRFEEKLYRESKKLLQKQFGTKGYPLAEVSGKALVYPATNKATVTYDIVPGPQCFFGETTVIGDNLIVKEKILDRARTYQPEELYDTRKVERTQRNLYNLDVFKAAVIEPEDPDPETGRVPMTLELKPKKQQNVKIGIGYGDEDGVRLKGAWTYRNLLGLAGKLKLEAKRSDLMEKVSAGYDQPYFWDSRSALQTEAGSLRETFDSYDNLRIFGTTKLTRRLERHIELTAAYLAEYSELQDLKLSDPWERIAFRRDNAYFISSIFLEIGRKTSNSDTNPKKGSVLTGSVEIAPSLLGSELTYFKPSIELITYYELPFRTVFAGRVKFQTISDLENNKNIPIFKRLFLGGANTVRGYGYQKLGPLDATGNPEGGQFTALGNIELRRPIYGIVSGVLFLDMGMVDTEEFHFNGSDMRYSTGGGIRIDTPVGPLRLDVGYKLNPLDTPDGAGKTDRWRLHFNIGHAF